ncbi:hypothetical protein LVJ94_10950 [Pendulispora rubella]|uniref:Uncharacterized protein n=1 Tax=Pendulispora rubella TaxID=2741070 RepID=A0ABZ2L9Z2_9BACT
MKLRSSHWIILFASALTPVLANVGCGDDGEGFTTTPDSGAKNDSGGADSGGSQPDSGGNSEDSGSPGGGDSGTGDGGIVDAGPAIYIVSATVDGLTPDAGGAPAQGLVLQNNGGNNLTVATDGTSQFTQRLPNNATYTVTVYQRPAGRSCTVEKGTGTVKGANPEAALVHCVPAPTYVVHTNVSGLGNAAQPLILRNNGGDDLRVITDTQNANQNNFAHQLGTGDKYAVTIAQQPSGRKCTVGSDGSGTVGAATVNVTVTCVPAYTVGGAVQGLTGTNSVILQNNGGDDTKVTANGANPVQYTFPTTLEDGAAYKVTVHTQPAGQTCTANTGAGSQPAEGKIDGANVNRVLFNCTTP